MSVPLPKSIEPLNQDQQNSHEPSDEKMQGAPTPPGARRLQWLKFMLRLGCTVALLAYILHTISGSDILKNLQNIDDGEIVAGVMIGLFGVIISSYQWQVLLDAERVRMDLRRLVNLYLVGIAFNHFLPTGMGGDVVKAYYVGRQGQNHVGSASAVIMSRVTGFLGMLFISGAVVLIWHATFSQELIVVYLLSCLAMCGALVAIFLGVILLPRFIRGKWATYPFVIHIMEFGITIRKSIRQPRAILLASFFGMIFHISAAVNYYIYASMLHLHVPFTFYMVAIPLVSLIAFLPISMNGFGVRELAFVSIFAAVNVARSTSLLLVTLIDAQVILYGIIGGGIYLWMGSKYAISKTAQQPAPIQI
jgi:glycosyltransferase 2 family protein